MSNRRPYIVRGSGAIAMENIAVWVEKSIFLATRIHLALQDKGLQESESVQSNKFIATWFQLYSSSSKNNQTIGVLFP